MNNTGPRIILDCQWGLRADSAMCHAFTSIQTFSSSIPNARVRIMAERDRAMLTKENSTGDKFDGRLVVPVEKGKFYLVTSCISSNSMTRVDDKIAYVLPDNESVERISPYLKSIFDDGKIILQEVKCEALNKEMLRASFYKNGVLINNKFSNVGLTPEIFAEAGMKFVGSEHDDSIVCALNEYHVLRNWLLNNSPVSKHVRHFKTLPCRGPLPLMIDSEGHDVLGKIYKPLLLLTKDIENRFRCTQCHASFIISDKDTVLHNEGYSPFELVVDILLKKTDVGSDEYTELLKQKLYIGNYEKPLKELSEAEENYKKTLEIHRTELLECRELLLTKIHPSKSDTDQIDNIDKDLEDIETMNGIFENKIVECIVNGFISARASLSSMQKRKEITPELNIDRENEAIKELQVTFTKLHFPDLPLNDLVEAGKFATLARSSLEDDLHASTLNRETLLREGDYLLSIYANIASILRTDLNLI